MRQAQEMTCLGGWVREGFPLEVTYRLRSKEEKELRIARAGRRPFPGTGNSMLRGPEKEHASFRK